MTGLAVFLLLMGAAWLLAMRQEGAGRWPLPTRQTRGAALRRAAETGNGASGLPPAGISDPALMLDLLAAMLESGRPLSAALEILEEATDPVAAAELMRLRSALAMGASWSAAWDLAESGRVHGTGGIAPLRPALTFAATTGAPAAGILYAHASQHRRRRSRDAEQRAAVLGVQLVLPLGLCSLPAFAALTVVPLLLSLLPAFR